MKKIFSLIFPLLYVAFLQAQAPANDNCEGATFIPNVTNYCSANGAFTTVGATPSGYGPATCFNSAKNDVWFSFIATNINITIAVTGTSPDKAGTMVAPAVALYDGECGVGNTIGELDCDFASPTNTANFIKGGIEIGKKYLIRVQPSSAGKDGTFRLCIKNFTPPKEPSGDCSSASVLCDKTSFSVAYTNGVGKVTNEITKANAPCFDNGSGGNDLESSSTWFKWTCEKAGTLTFDLTPLGVTDDLDFALFQLPQNLDDCANKKLLRCMASGNPKSSYPSPCHGNTGLNTTATDISEDAGCAGNKDNYLKALDMEVGAHYILVVNNYSDSGDGFDVSFGGTSTFLGPTAKFKTTTTKKVCFGENLTYEDQSFYSNGAIKSWSWNFGQGATPKTLKDATKPPLHSVAYNTVGTKYVALTLESDKGCLITAIDSFTVDSCCSTINKIETAPTIKNLACPDLLEGEIKLNPTTKIPTTYTWDLGQTTPTISNLGAGQYKVTVSNAATCDFVYTFDVKSPLPIITDTLLKKPTCNGGKDGIITLVPSGGTAPYEYDFGNGYAPNNTEKNLAIGKYPIFIKDVNGCLKAITVDLKELELNLDPTIKALKPPSCFGLSDGSITLNIFNGKSPFLYDFGSGFQNGNSISNLASGTYNITVQDDNLCKGVFNFNVKQPDKIVLKADTVVISCNGANDGKAYVEATGGTGAYKYLWNDTKKQTTQNATELAPGIYTVSVSDENNCVEIIQVGLNQPPLLGVKGNLKNLLCYNDRTGEIQFIGEGGRPPYQFSLDGVVFQKNDLFKNLPAGPYSLIVRDTANCEFQVPVNLSQPSPFIVNAGSDQTIELGETASLFAETSPVGKNVKSWMWTPDTSLTCRDCPNPIANPFKTTSYTIKAIDETGCAAVDRLTVIVSKPRRTFPPNVFSPGNDDGINDRFTIFTDRSAKKIQLMRVFDRWGNLVFEGADFPPNDSNFGWDGTFRSKKSPEGVYTWVVLMEYLDGEVISYKGDISLVR